VTGSDGNLWFVDNGVIGKIDPADGSVTVVATAGTTPGFDNGNLGPVTLGPDGNVWAVGVGHSAVSVTPAGDVTEHLISDTTDDYASITTACDGNLWITSDVESDTDVIFRLTPSGTATPFAAPADSGPQGIAAGPDDNVWVTGFFEPGTVMRVGTGCEAPAPPPPPPPPPPAPTPVAVTPLFTG
jgi:virginiamycin B lyase